MAAPAVLMTARFETLTKLLRSGVRTSAGTRCAEALDDLLRCFLRSLPKPGPIYYDEHLNLVSKIWVLSAGARLGPYEILAPLGAGGMGEVYRARDTRLHREVAIKVLPTSFSQDADRLRRFEQEARAASALNHPGILTIHDFGEHDGAPYVVSELLEGETLRERLAGGRIPVRK